MENRPTIRIQGSRIQPEYQERYTKWLLEVYLPLFMKVPEMRGIDCYKITKQNPQYPPRVVMMSYANRIEQVKVRSSPIVADVQKDIRTTWMSRTEVIWYPAYELIKNFRNQNVAITAGDLLNTEKAPILQMEGYSLSPEDREKFETWFTKWGYELYIPWLMKSAGLSEYSFYRLIDVDLTGAPGRQYNTPRRAVEHPSFLSILHFENLDAYERYENSVELAGFRDHIRLSLPNGLDFKWYVQHQLLKSFRK